MTDTLLLIGHGSREPDANSAFESCVAAFRARHPAQHVNHGYVELAVPDLNSALDHAAHQSQQVTVLPVFLFASGHVKNDLPLALARARAAHPQVRFNAARALGVHSSLVDLAQQRLHAVRPAGVEARHIALVVVGRGAGDPDANGDFYKAARLIGEGHHFSGVAPCFMGISAPRLPDTLEMVARSRPQHIIVLPYLLFRGRLVTALQAQVDAFAARYPWIGCHVADVLGEDARLHQALDDRCEQAQRGLAALPCDTCQYRAPIGAIAQQVGGIRALLWSVRHAFTHTQAMPHEHAHRPLAKHVLVCGNVDCAAAGSLALLQQLRRLVKAAGRQADIRITRTACMGRCGEGPTVAVYPDGIWYRGVKADDATDVVQEHLLGDRLVARLVDNIMQ